MRIVVDENIPLKTVRALRQQGHDVRDIRQTPNEGMDDAELWTLAQGDLRLLITTDKGFGRYRDESHQGILIVRLRRPNRDRIHERVIRAMQQVAEADWPGLLLTMRDRVRSAWRAAGEEKNAD